MSGSQIGSTFLSVLILNVAILMGYWVMNKDGNEGLRFDWPVSFSSVYSSMENAIKGFGIAFVSSASVVVLAKIISEFFDDNIHNLVTPFSILFASTIWALALVPMRNLWNA